MTSSTVALGQAWSNLGEKQMCFHPDQISGCTGLYLVDEKELLSEILLGRALKLSQTPGVVPADEGLLHQAVHQSVLLLVGHQTWSCPPYPGQTGRSEGG